MTLQLTVADLGEGSWGPDPSYLKSKKEEMTERRKARSASKIEPEPLLSSKSGSATVWVKVWVTKLLFVCNHNWVELTSELALVSPRRNSFKLDKSNAVRI